jgi:hypothetical protein
MRDDLVTPQEEKAVRELMLSGLTLGPREGASQLLARARRQQRRRMVLVSLAAALLLCLYAASPFVLPALARVVGAVPGIGPAFQKALELQSLDLAYEAGFMPALDKSVERAGVVLTVHTAYRDAESFELVLSLSGDHSLIAAIRESIGPRVELTAGRWQSRGHTTYKSYDEIGNVLYVSLSSQDPLPWYVRKVNVTVQWMTDPAEIEKFQSFVSWDDVQLSEPLALTFPLQKLSEAHNEVLPINQTLTCGDTQVFLQSLTFSPVRTILKYTYTGPEPVLRLFDEQGSEVRCYTVSADIADRRATFAATDSRTLTVRLAGYPAESTLEVPLKEGYEHTGELAFRIESIEPVHQLLPWIRPGGGHFYADTRVVLSWEQEPTGLVAVHGGSIDWGESGKTTLYLIRERLPDDQLLQLRFMRLEGEPQEITVSRQAK